VYAFGLALATLVGVSLGFFGGGGSILTVPLLVYVFGLEPKVAIASSLLVVAVASVTAAAQHWRAGNVELRTALLFGSAGMTGAYLGGRLGELFDGALLLLLFAAMMVLTAVAMWQGRRAPAPEDVRRSRPRLLAQGLAVGSFTGLVGAGGGFLIVPALALWAGLPMNRAVGTSLCVIVMQTLAAFAGYRAHTQIDYAVVAGVGAGAVAGSFAGIAFTRRVNPASLRRAFAGFVLAMAAFVLVREIETWIGPAREAIPHSGPQLVFALVVLAIGIGAGRVSRGMKRLDEAAFEQGGGI
jgi:hypothetical protein